MKRVVHIMTSNKTLCCDRKITKNTIIEKDHRVFVPLEHVCLKCAWRIGSPHYDDFEIDMEGQRRHKNTYNKNGVRVLTFDL